MTFCGVRRNQAIQVDQENQAAVRRNRRTGKEFHATQIIAQVLDDDFVLAEDFFHDDADMFSGHLHDDHVKVAVQRLKRRQSELQVQADYFRNRAANAR